MSKKLKSSFIYHNKPLIIGSIVLSIFFSIFSLLLDQSYNIDLDGSAMQGQFMINNSYQNISEIDVNHISEYEAKQLIRNIQNNFQ